MQVITLRTAKSLPREIASLPEFYVRIAGDITRCTSLAEAQRATAYFPQTARVTFMTPAAHAAYIAKRS
jgi:hypothetical protein